MHRYRVEVTVAGKKLNKSGFLINLVSLAGKVEQLVSYFENHLLNDKDEFKNLNPSLENFAQVFCERISGELEAPNIERVHVKMWEDNVAWAEYSENSV
jgi:6-pyruvoyltetrahydropterin/6-carboxytetrahydropterin synthase